ncbi:MAG: calcium/sodium antiporter [Myxococcota bacterium]
MNAHLWVDIAWIGVSIVLLWKGADGVVYASARIASRFGLSDVVIGMTVVAIGTSAPEMVVTLVAALRHQPEISVGNVVGSNIFNLGFILGGCAVLRTLPTSRSLVVRDAVMLLLSASLLALFFVGDSKLTRMDGALMIAILGAYVLYLFHRDEPLVDETEAPDRPAETGPPDFWDAPLVLVSLAAVVGGAHLLVGSATEVARTLGLSEWAIAMTIVAGGTSLPELATSVAAVLRGHPGLVAGNLIGSDLFNMLGVLGLAALFHPLQIHSTAMGSIVMMVAMVGLVALFMRTGWRLTRLEGAFLILLAILRWSRDLTPSLWS